MERNYVTVALCIQKKQQHNNTTTINVFPRKGFKNPEDTAEKALAQY